MNLHAAHRRHHQIAHDRIEPLAGLRACDRLSAIVDDRDLMFVARQ